VDKLKPLKKIKVGDIVATNEFVIHNDVGGSSYISGWINFKVIQFNGRRSVKGIIQKSETIEKIRSLGVTKYGSNSGHEYDPSIIWAESFELYSPCDDDDSFEKII